MMASFPTNLAPNNLLAGDDKEIDSNGFKNSSNTDSDNILCKNNTNSNKHKANDSRFLKHLF